LEHCAKTDTDFAPRAQVIAPGEPDLATLAKQINAEHDAFKLALMSTCERAVATGKKLLRARELVDKQLGPGHWLEWLAANTHVPERTAQRYMDIAKKEPELLAKSPDLSSLTVTGKLRLIEELKDPDDKSGITQRSASKSRKSPLDTAIEKDALNVLKKAWRKCNEEQQEAFRSEIGAT
jgi:hypothetical protein